MVLLVSGCPFMGLAYEEDLAGGYAVWATDAIEDAAIVYRDKDGPGATVVVPAMVFAYGWNDHFILAKRHPTEDYTVVDMETTEWYVVQVDARAVHGPLGEDEFRKLRTELGVPPELSFTKTISR
jgi:hypothetical protein